MWDFCWQEESEFSQGFSQTVTGGNFKHGKSTSGWDWINFGEHCIKTWNPTKRAYALSSAEAEFYAMIEMVAKAKGLLT